MYDIGKPMIIDVAGTIKQAVKWALVEILLFVALIAFALSAPFLFTVGAWWFASRFDLAAEVAVVELFVAGPIACAVWMSILSHWPDWVADWKARKAGGYIARSRFSGTVKGIGFMFTGLVGSLLIGLGFTYVAHRLSIIPDHKMLFLMVLPFAVFAPCWLVVLSRWIRRDEYATA